MATPSAAASDGAGSVVTSSVRAPGRSGRPEAAGGDRANSAAQVVFPTPPLPPTRCHLMFVAFEARLGAGDPHGLRRDGGRLAAVLAFPDLADAREDIGFELVELHLGQLSQLQSHLCIEQPLTERAVVVELGVDSRRDL